MTNKMFHIVVMECRDNRVQRILLIYRMNLVQIKSVEVSVIYGIIILNRVYNLSA